MGVGAWKHAGYQRCQNRRTDALAASLNVVKSAAINKRLKNWPRRVHLSWGARARFWLLYLLVITCVVVGLLEVSTRLAGISPALPEQYSRNVSDPYLPWKPEPLSTVRGQTAEFSYEYRHNSVGFRDEDHATSKPAGTFRILGLGDSFTYGAGAKFEETYLYRVERLLNDGRQEPKVEVIKAGIARYWPEPERMLLEHYGLAYEPDLVTVAFLPNDILDTHTGIRGLNVSQGFLITRQLEPFGGFGSWLFVHSQLFRTLFIRHLTSRLGAESARANDSQAANIYGPSAFYEQDWQSIEAEFDKMARLTRRAGAQLAVIFIPQRDPWPPDQTDYPHKRLMSWCAAHGVTFIDTCPALIEADSQGERPYWPQDGHCTGAGHAVIAKVVSSALLPILQARAATSAR